MSEPEIGMLSLKAPEGERETPAENATAETRQRFHITNRINDNFGSIFYSTCFGFSPGPKPEGDSSKLNQLPSLSHISKHLA